MIHVLFQNSKLEHLIKHLLHRTQLYLQNIGKLKISSASSLEPKLAALPAHSVALSSLCRGPPPCSTSLALKTHPSCYRASSVETWTVNLTTVGESSQFQRSVATDRQQMIEILQFDELTEPSVASIVLATLQPIKKIQQPNIKIQYSLRS